MLDNPRQDPQGGMIRGIALICAIGIGLGVAYNALGLASRPKYGLAWIKAAPAKIESLESLQSAPATGSESATAGEAHAAPAPGSPPAEATPAPGAPATSAAAAPAE
jgi:hypothetical protein